MNLLHQSTHIQSISQVLAKEVFVDNNSRNIDCPTGRDFRRRADRAKCAADMLDSHAVQLSKEDVEVLEDLIETCKTEDPNGFSWKMIIDW